ncbi:MAG: hypothetical protein H6Q90_5175 [Deltaproteobacteria bacterium]|nr:hypothetical protein [Deltaproteobacteria bacterium]
MTMPGMAQHEQGGWHAAAAIACIVTIAGCQDVPSDEAIDRMREEAIHANAELKALVPTDTGPGTTLTISGQIGKPGATLDWKTLQQLGTTHVRTINIQNPSQQQPTDFRGVLVRDLLDRFEAAPEATEATMVSIDGFRATVQIADARTYRMLLAVEADGAPISRTAGGPIFLVHPFTESGPELRWKYPDRFWAFYVTHVVVGTEPPRLVIAERGRAGHVLDREALAKLPSTTLDGRVGWKVDWPADSVHLRGVSLVEAIAAAGLALPAQGRIVIHGKAPIHDDPAKPITIAIADLPRCKPLLAMQWGPSEQPIPAKLGGPIAMAITPCGESYGDRSWVTFVEKIEVETP